MPQCIETTGAGSGALLKRCNDNGDHDDKHGTGFDHDHNDRDDHDYCNHHDVGVRAFLKSVTWQWDDFHHDDDSDHDVHFDHNSHFDHGADFDHIADFDHDTDDLYHDMAEK